jgi:hypothetical protein
MSNAPTFTTHVQDFPARDGLSAFTATNLGHKRGTVAVSGFEPADRNAHASVHVHKASGLDINFGETDSGEPTFTLDVAGEVRTSITLYGVSLDDLQAAIDAARKTS